MTTVRAAVCTGLNEPWKTEEIEIDPPGNREVRVKMVWSGMCHSDEHLRTGDISQTPEVLELMGVKSMFPVVGGHEGSGVVTEVGGNVTQVVAVRPVADHAAGQGRHAQVAQILATRCAPVAGPARRYERHRHMIAQRDLGHVGPDLGHDT